MESSIENKLDQIITYLSSINYLLMYGDKIDKSAHFEEMNRRITQAKAELDHHQ